MNTIRLALDYLDRAKKRKLALQVLYEQGAYADVIREAQEAMELILKGVLRYIGVEPPKRHEVSHLLRKYAKKLPQEWQDDLENLVMISTTLVEERSHAFYGDEGTLIPASELFTQEDAEMACKAIEKYIDLFERFVASTGEGR